LINVTDSQKNQSKFIVRGNSKCGYHNDIFDLVTPKIESAGLKCECVGGGRILHKPKDKILIVYGYSQGYGKADHVKTVEILKTKYPDYNITWSDDGY